VYGCGAWSQGPMVLEALNILERLDLKTIGHNTPSYIHAVTEALKLAAADREAYFGDPNFVDVPLDVLLSKSYATERRALFDPARAWPGMPPAGQATNTAPVPWHPDPSSMPAPASAAPAREVPAGEVVETATSFLSVADAAGNIFAATPSDGTIGGPVVPGTGIMVS